MCRSGHYSHDLVRLIFEGEVIMQCNKILNLIKQNLSQCSSITQLKLAIKTLRFKLFIYLLFFGFEPNSVRTVQSTSLSFFNMYVYSNCYYSTGISGQCSFGGYFWRYLENFQKFFPNHYCKLEVSSFVASVIYAVLNES
jgi:hypothetical protein